MKKYLIWIVVALLLVSVTSAMADDPQPTYTEVWDGRGADSEACEYAGQPGRPESGWIHWVFNTKGKSTDAELVLSGSGSGSYGPDAPLNANVWHFFTPYYDLGGLNATIRLFGGDPGKGGGLVISDYCPGLYEELEVSKTVSTSFTRTHNWDIAKSVDTDLGFEHDGLPKIWLYVNGDGNETATWTVDVTYEGYTDSEHNVSGSIYIENTGTLPAVITEIEDKLGGAAIDVDCGGTLPITLFPGDDLTCTYDEDGYVTGSNVVKVTTQRAVYSDTKPVVWGAPTTEVNKTVHVKDVSDLFGEVALGSVTAPNGDTFTYDKDFAWADYGGDLCGDYEYDNTATIVETGQYATATLKVNVQCFIYETAYAKGNDPTCFIPTFSRWGWTQSITPYKYTWDLWAGAAQCDTTKGILVGHVEVDYDIEGNVTVTYHVSLPYSLDNTHVYAGTTPFPLDNQGEYTVAPGSYYNASPFDGSSVYVIAHAVVGIPDPDFGP